MLVCSHINMKCGCGFLFVRYKRQFCTELVRSIAIPKVRSWEVAFVYLYTIPAIASVLIERLSSGGRVCYVSLSRPSTQAWKSVVTLVCICGQ